MFALFLRYLDQQDLFVEMDSTYSFNITATVLSFAITATVACVLATGFSIHILFRIPTPFHGSTKVFMVIAHGAHITFAVLAFAFLEIARKQHGTKQKFENVSLAVLDCALEMVIFLFILKITTFLETSVVEASGQAFWVSAGWSFLTMVEVALTLISAFVGTPRIKVWVRCSIYGILIIKQIYLIYFLTWERRGLFRSTTRGVRIWGWIQIISLFLTSVTIIVSLVLPLKLPKDGLAIYWGNFCFVSVSDLRFSPFGVWARYILSYFRPGQPATNLSPERAHESPSPPLRKSADTSYSTAPLYTPNLGKENYDWRASRASLCD